MVCTDRKSDSRRDLTISNIHTQRSRFQKKRKYFLIVISNAHEMAQPFVFTVFAIPNGSWRRNLFSSIWFGFTYVRQDTFIILTTAGRKNPSLKRMSFWTLCKRSEESLTIIRRFFLASTITLATQCHSKMWNTEAPLLNIFSYGIPRIRSEWQSNVILNGMKWSEESQPIEKSGFLVKPTGLARNDKSISPQSLGKIFIQKRESS